MVIIFHYEFWSAISNLNKQAKLSYCRGPTISHYVPKVHYKIEKASTRCTLIYRLSGKICLCVCDRDSKLLDRFQ